MKFILIFLFLIGEQSAFPSENEWSLRGGAGINFQTLKGEDFSEDEILGLSITTSFGYRFSNLALNTASYISAGKADNLYFKVGGDTEILADSNFVTINFMFLAKYNTDIIILKNNSLYFSLGPGIGIQSYWPTQYTVLDGSFSYSDKITYEIWGIFAAVGIEERSLFKEEFPKFLEVLFGFTQSYKAYLVNSEDSKTSIIISSDPNSSNFKNFILSFNFGITFF